MARKATPRGVRMHTSCPGPGIQLRLEKCSMYKYKYKIDPISFTELRQNLARHLDAVAESGQHITVTRQGGGRKPSWS